MRRRDDFTGVVPKECGPEGGAKRLQSRECQMASFVSHRFRAPASRIRVTTIATRTHDRYDRCATRNTARIRNPRCSNVQPNAVRRRTVRDFHRVPYCASRSRCAIAAAGCAPSGRNASAGILRRWRMQIFEAPDLRGRGGQGTRVLRPSRACRLAGGACGPGTDASKPFLEIGTWLIANFSQKNSDGRTAKNSRTAIPSNRPSLPPAS